MSRAACLTMGHKELDRLEVAQRALERRLTQREGAQGLGVSVRQMGRLCLAHRERGPQGLISKKRGQRSNRQYPDCVRELATRLVCEYHRDFGPLSEHDAHRPLLPTEDLGRTFTWQEQRKLSKNLTISYKHVLYVVEPTPDNLGLAGRRCRVYEWEDGGIELVADGRTLAFTAFDKRPFVNPVEIVTNKRLGAALLWAQKQQQARDYDRLSSPKVTLREKQRIRERACAADAAMNRTLLNCEEEDISRMR